MTPEQKQLIRDFIKAVQDYEKLATQHRRYLRDQLMVKVGEMVK